MRIKNKQLNIRVDEKLMDKFKMKLLIDKSNASQWVTQKIQEYLKK